MNNHFCQEHKAKFFRNEKTDKDGQIKVWYSHKKADGTGFCQEQPNSTEQSIYSCNAMNNAVALVSSGKISLEEIGDYHKKLLSSLATA